MESIEEWFPGYYFATDMIINGPDGGTATDFLAAFEFRTDHTVHDLNVYCDGRPDEIRLVHDWRATDRGTVEIVLREPLSPGGDPGDVYKEVFVENAPCGPHRIVRSTLERDYYAGRYCVTNFKPGSGHVGVDHCDVVACDERAKMCAEETADVE